MEINFTLSSFLLTILLIPLTIKIARKTGMVDIPDKRKIHKYPTPRTGGLAIFAGVLLSLILFVTINKSIIILLTSSLIIFFTGIMDDMYDLSPWIKLFWQFVAATVVIFWGGIRFKIGGNYSGFLNFEVISIIISYLWIIGVTNAINLIDGMDGLAGGISFFSFGALTFISFLKGFYIQGIISSLFLGSIVAFLNFNLPPAIIFLGDAGSLLLGFNIAVLSLSVSYKTGTVIAIIFPALFVLIPVADTILAFIRRVLKGKNPLTNPDKGHIHHKLLLLKFSINQALIIFYFFSGIFTTIAVTLKSKSILNGIIFSLTAIFLLFTAIYLFEKSKFDEKIEKFNNFTDRLKQAMKREESKQSKSITIILFLITGFYILSLFIVTFLSAKITSYNTILLLLFSSYITGSLFAIYLKTRGKTLSFLGYWIDFLLIYLLCKLGFEKKIIIFLVLITPFFLYKLFQRKKITVFLPAPEDIFLFFSVLNIYLLGLEKDLKFFLYPAILFFYKRVIKEDEITQKRYHLTQSIIFIFFTLALIFKML